MPHNTTIEKILSDLDLLMPQDFNLSNIEANGMEQLWVLTERLAEVGEPEKVMDILFHVIERLSNSEEIDPRYDLGTPGPLVHTLEKYQGQGYEQYLIISIKRYPTPLTIWMINRILNITHDTQERDNWLKMLEAVNNHPLASLLVKKEAQRFLEYQAKINR